MYKYSKNKFKQGDISLLVTLLVCSILLILLAPIAQKVSVESKISKENLMSQQAVQAARTGIDAWVYEFTKPTGSNIDINNSSRQNLPNDDDKWIVLDSPSGIQYRVELIKGSGSNPSIIRSRGRVERDSMTIERVLEDERKDL
jgi:type II secretory pathway pseudopilin PulG